MDEIANTLSEFGETFKAISSTVSSIIKHIGGDTDEEDDQSDDDDYDFN